MDRFTKLRAKMDDEGIDLVVLGPGAHLGWLTGVRPHADERALLFCVTANHAAFLMPSLEVEGVRRQTDLPFFEWADADGPEGALMKMLDSFGVENAQSIAIDETMRADHAGLIQDHLINARRQFCESTLSAMRARKDADEYAKLKNNALLADQAILTEGDAVVMDIGAGRDGFSSDITRMAVIGSAPEGYEQVHAIVEAAVQAAMATARPGVAAHEVDKAARTVITDAGYGEYFMHRLGHGMGVEVHEPPYISASSQVVLDENMVFSIEPGIYLPGRFGLRLEDIVILRADGPEILSGLSRELRVIA